MEMDPRYPYKILYSDESRFTNNGMFNRNNTRYWAHENEHLVRGGNFQERFGFNVWMAMVAQHLISPIIFDGSLTGERYSGFLQNEISDLIDGLPLAVANNLIFQQDGAPAHNCREVVQYLNNNLNERG
ncbi:hypothetical protein HHI36_022237 [Cryptolaemus montrouzieri]|uniref:Transposase n=1 Tax=Cryptolaemus montrouzieri TaxID=559131 RepID=A0ABD2N018_9CUCU